MNIIQKINFALIDETGVLVTQCQGHIAIDVDILYGIHMHRFVSFKT